MRRSTHLWPINHRFTQFVARIILTWRVFGPRPSSNLPRHTDGQAIRHGCGVARGSWARVNGREAEMARMNSNWICMELNHRLAERRLASVDLPPPNAVDGDNGADAAKGELCRSGPGPSQTTIYNLIYLPPTR